MMLPIILLKFRLKYMPRFAGKYDLNLILRSQGIEVGEHTIFYDPNSIQIDRERPWMLKIGDYCKITSGTIILAHDYSRSVLRRVYGDIVGEAGQTTIGNNVFIGMNSIILMGSYIGDNVIIGAGSVVSGSIPSNCVAAGNPCRVIRSLDDQYHRRKKMSIEEAKMYYSSFCERYGRKPSIMEMGPFFWQFLERDPELIKKYNINLLLNGDDQEDILKSFINSKPIYNGFNEFESVIQNDPI